MKRIVTITSLISLLAIVGLMSPIPAEMAASSTTSPVLHAVATQDEAWLVAENWIRFVVERDGDWAGSTSPSIGEFSELRRGDLLLGYYASVEPKGYIIVSSLKDFSPVKAYSTTSNLDPDAAGGMAAFLKADLENRASFLIDRFGGLDEVSLQELHNFTSNASRLEWSHLLEGGPAMRAHLESIYAEDAGPEGASKWGEILLKTSWHQLPPYNHYCPNKSCSWPFQGYFNENAPVGCVPLAMAQIMRYYAWPPHSDWLEWWGYYDWSYMVNRYVWNDTEDWFEDENGNLVTAHQIEWVAFICRHAGQSLEDWLPGCGIDYQCEGTSAYTCNWACNDARDAFEDYFAYSSPDADEPWCEDAPDYSVASWWSMIRQEIDLNRPVQYSIRDHDFGHSLVVDGYDTGNRVHANYGWDDAHTAWYTVDDFDCDAYPGHQHNCDWNETTLVRHIYPRDGLCSAAHGSYSGTLDPWGGPGSYHHYVYCDVNGNNLTVEGGARVQFLPGTSITCETGSVDIQGASPDETRFFSDGLTTRGLKVAAGGHLELSPGGEIRVY